MKNLLLMAFAFLTVNTFAQDMMFVSPAPGTAAKGSLKIQLAPPVDNPSQVRVYIQNEVGMDQIVWQGTVTAAGKFSTTVDISKFAPGRYKVKSEYFTTPAALNAANPNATQMGYGYNNGHNNGYNNGHNRRNYNNNHYNMSSPNSNIRIDGESVFWVD